MDKNMQEGAEWTNNNPAEEAGQIDILGARVHNLKNIDLSIPRHRLVVITGLSGSGKSSLAFDTIYAEGQRRYIETFSAYARQFLGGMERPDVDKITGLSPVISIEQKTTGKNPRSTVGTITEIYDFLRLLYARAGEAFSYLSGEKMVKYTDSQIIDLILEQFERKNVYVLAPMIKGRKGHYKELFEQIRRKGFIHVRVDGQVQEIRHNMKVDRYKNHFIEVVVDKLRVESKDRKRLEESIKVAMKQGHNTIMLLEKDQEEPRFWASPCSLAVRLASFCCSWRAISRCTSNVLLRCTSVGWAVSTGTMLMSSSALSIRRRLTPQACKCSSASRRLPRMAAS